MLRKDIRQRISSQSFFNPGPQFLIQYSHLPCLRHLAKVNPIGSSLVSARTYVAARAHRNYACRPIRPRTLSTRGCTPAPQWPREEVGRRKVHFCDFSLAITNRVIMSDMKLHPEANQRKFAHVVYGGVGQRRPAGHLPKAPVLSTQNADANRAASSHAPSKPLTLNDFGFMPLLIIVN